MSPSSMLSIDRLDDVDAHALDRDGGLPRERLDELPLLERHPVAGRAASIDSTPTAPRTVLTRHVQPLAAGERLGAAARRLIVLEHPRGGRPLGARSSVVAGWLDGAHRRAGPTPGASSATPLRRSLRHVPDDDAERVVEPVRAGDLARERVERRGARLALPRGAPPGRGRAPSAGS